MTIKSLEKKRLKLIRQTEKIKSTYENDIYTVRNKIENINDQIQFLEEQYALKAMKIKPGDWFMNGSFYVKILSRTLDSVVVLSIIALKHNISASVHNYDIRLTESWKKCKAPDTSVFVKAIDYLMNKNVVEHKLKS